MISRRYLRIKVYQSLYAFFQSDGGSAAKIEKELLLSVDRTFDMVVGLLLIFGELHRTAGRRIEDGRLKHLPTPEDLDPNLRFLENPMLAAIVNNALLQEEAEKRRINWMGQGELMGRLYKEFTASEDYQRYMALPEPTFKQHQAAVLSLFMEHIAHFEPLHDLFETRSIYWLEDLDLACSLVKRIVESMRASGARDLGLGDILRPPMEEREFVRVLFRLTVEHSEEYGTEIAARASNWELDRIAVSDMILMKMAITEAREFHEIPVKVTLNEYIEIAKAYSTPKSTGFINGILDKLFIAMKENGSIKKVGRGLLES